MVYPKKIYIYFMHSILIGQLRIVSLQELYVSQPKYRLPNAIELTQEIIAFDNINQPLFSSFAANDNLLIVGSIKKVV